MSESRATFDALPVGYRLDDYRIVEVLGKGGFGITYKALDERLERQVAVKEYLPRDYAFRGDQSMVLPRGDAEKPTFEWGLKRFVDEARALALFRHRNIVSVLRYLEANGTAYLVMEYEEGEDLDHWLIQRSNVTETELVQKILLPVLDGLEKVHAKQLLHRDIKPANIFVRTDGTPVLIDFGASRAHGAQGATNMTTIISAGYSPFEQYGGGNVRQGPWTDLYALAGTMYRIIAGHAPVDAIARMQGQELVPAVVVGQGHYSAGVLRAIDRALSLEAKDRPQSVAEFRSLISSCADAPTVAAVTADATVVRRGPAPNVTRKRGAAALVVVLLAIGGAGWYFALGPGKPGAALPPPVTTTDASVGPAPANETTEAPSPQGASVAGLQPAIETPEPPAVQEAQEPRPPANLEDEIVNGLDMPSDVYAFRESHIAGTLLAYVRTKNDFDECQKVKCQDSQTLMQAVLANQEGSWKQPANCQGDACTFAGTVKITNPRRLDREGCAFLIDVTEVLRHADAQRTQVRTYCTENGFNRHIDSAGPVT